MIGPLGLQKAAMKVAVRYRHQGVRYHGMSDVVADMRAEYACSDIPSEEYEMAFTSVRPIYEAALECMKTHPVTSLQPDPKTDLPNMDHLIPELRKVVDGYADEVYRLALEWAYFWMILK